MRELHDLVQQLQAVHSDLGTLEQHLTILSTQAEQVGHWVIGLLVVLVGLSAAHLLVAVTKK